MPDQPSPSMPDAGVPRAPGAEVRAASPFPRARGVPVAGLGVLALSGAMAWAAGGGAAGFVIVGAGAVLALLADRVPAADPPAPVPPRAATVPLIDDPRLAALFADHGAPVLGVREGRLRWANRRALRLVGDHAIGKDVRMAIRHPAATPLLRAEDGAPGPAGTALLPGLGVPGALWRIDAARLADGGLVAMLTDTGAAAAAERAHADFVANASHELRTPLSAVLGYLETLSDPDVADDVATRDRFLAIAEREAGRMVRLLDDLFSLSRIHADRHQLPAESVALPALIADIVADLPDRPAGRAADVAITPGDALSVAGDRVQLAQALRNILVNAMKYGAAGTPIRLTLVRDGDHALLSVTDRGEGIAPEHVPRLTERFYRVDAARSRSLGGTGLGLAIVAQVVERHRGRLFIESRRGVGTTVSMRLPLADAGHRTAPEADG